MFEHKRKAVAAFAMAASFMMMLCAFAAAAPGSNAAHEATDLSDKGYGDPYSITIAPGFEWGYTITFPTDLLPGIKLELKVNDLNSNAEIKKTDEGTANATYVLNVKIPSGYTNGTYNIVLMAEHEASGQTETNGKAAYQWIKLTVNAELHVEANGVLEQILKGASQNFNLVSTGGLGGTVTWAFKDETDNHGFDLDGTTVSGKCDTAGPITLYFVATSDGQTKDLEVTFTVYNIIKVGENDTIYAIGGAGTEETELLAGVEQDGTDLNVKWTATGSMPAGLKLNESTGAITGSYTGTTAGSVDITLTVTSEYPKNDDQNGQEAEKTITICYEPKLTFSAVEKVKTWSGNTDVTGEEVVFTSAHSTITSYALKNAIAGVDVSSTGALVVKGTEAATTDNGSAVIVATTTYGQTAQIRVSYLVEPKLTVSADAKLVSDAGHSNAIDISITGPTKYTTVLSDGLGGTLHFDWATKKLSLSSCKTLYSEADNKTVTITINSEAGQTDTITIQIVNYSALEFTSTPSATGIKVSVS